jgi:hypothetical protein
MRGVAALVVLAGVALVAAQLPSQIVPVLPAGSKWKYYDGPSFTKVGAARHTHTQAHAVCASGYCNAAADSANTAAGARFHSCNRWRIVPACVRACSDGLEPPRLH